MNKAPLKPVLKNSVLRNEQFIKRGTLLFIEGEKGKDMFVVRSGKVRLFKQDTGGSRLALVCLPGTVFGEMGLLTEECRSVTAQVVEDSQIMTIDQELYLATIKKIPAWIGSSINSLFIRLMETIRATTEDIARQSIGAFIRVLLLVAENEGVKNGSEIRVLFARVRDTAGTVMGLAGDEIEKIIMHLIFKQMVVICKDIYEQEYIDLKKADALYLYMNYLRARQRGDSFPGEHFRPATFAFIDKLLSSQGLTEVREQTTFIRVAMAGVADASSGQVTPEVINQLVEADCIRVEENALLYKKEKLALMQRLGDLLPIFKEDIKI